jgi:hypothetical protein
MFNSFLRFNLPHDFTRSEPCIRNETGQRVIRESEKASGSLRNENQARLAIQWQRTARAINCS